MKTYLLITSPNMAVSENGSRPRGLREAVTGLLALGLTSFSGAEAQDRNNAPEQSEQYASLTTTIARTQADCLKLGLGTQEEIIACARGVSKRNSKKRQAEIAALDARNKKLDEALAIKTTELEQLRATLKVLRRVEAILQGDDPNQIKASQEEEPKR